MLYCLENDYGRAINENLRVIMMPTLSSQVVTETIPGTIYDGKIGIMITLGF